MHAPAAFCEVCEAHKRRSSITQSRVLTSETDAQEASEDERSRPRAHSCSQANGPGDGMPSHIQMLGPQKTSCLVVLDEAHSLGLLTEALTAHVEAPGESVDAHKATVNSPLADETGAVGADAALAGALAEVAGAWMSVVAADRMLRDLRTGAGGIALGIARARAVVDFRGGCGHSHWATGPNNPRCARSRTGRQATRKRRPKIGTRSV